MNPLDQSLERLFKAAAQAPEPEPEPEAPPYYLETRVLEAWRSQERPDDFALLMGLFRRAVIFAAVVMILSIVWSRREKPNPAASVVALANYEINTHLPP